MNPTRVAQPAASLSVSESDIGPSTAALLLSRLRRLEEEVMELVFKTDAASAGNDGSMGPSKSEDHETPGNLEASLTETNRIQCLEEENSKLRQNVSKLEKLRKMEGDELKRLRDQLVGINSNECHRRGEPQTGNPQLIDVYIHHRARTASDPSSPAAGASSVPLNIKSLKRKRDENPVVGTSGVTTESHPTSKPPPSKQITFLQALRSAVLSNMDWPQSYD
ncbi:hypothetical protein C8J57DRAFT_1706639, partial [Mycena rebaudengoi]